MAADLAITSADFNDKVLNSDVPVLVDFWATWCQPCLRVGPTIEELAAENQGKAQVYKLDIDNNDDIASNYGVMSIPAFIVFSGGQEVERVVGASPGIKQQLQGLLDRAGASRQSA